MKRRRMKMFQATGQIAIAGVFAMVMMIIFFKNKAEYIINLLVRAVIGVISIYLANQALLYLGYNTQVGINAVTVLTSAVLGIPGVFLMFGISFF